MNVNIKAHILKKASHLLCTQITNGNPLVATKVRDNGNIIEWHLANGDTIEVINNVDYATGLVIVPSTSMCHWVAGDMVYEQCFVGDSE